MTLVKMLQTRKVCEDGFAVRQLDEECIYDLRESCARECFREGWAVKPSEWETLEYQKLHCHFKDDDIELNEAIKAGKLRQLIVNRVANASHPMNDFGNMYIATMGALND